MLNKKRVIRSKVKTSKETYDGMMVSEQTQLNSISEFSNAIDEVSEFNHPNNILKRKVDKACQYISSKGFQPYLEKGDNDTFYMRNGAGEIRVVSYNEISKVKHRPYEERHFSKFLFDALEKSPLYQDQFTLINFAKVIAFYFDYQKEENSELGKLQSALAVSEYYHLGIVSALEKPIIVGLNQLKPSEFKNEKIREWQAKVNNWVKVNQSRFDKSNSVNALAVRILEDIPDIGIKKRQLSKFLSELKK